MVAADAASQHESGQDPHTSDDSHGRGRVRAPWGPAPPTPAPTTLAGNLRQWCPVPAVETQCWQNSRHSPEDSVARP